MRDVRVLWSNTVPILDWVNAWWSGIVVECGVWHGANERDMGFGRCVTLGTRILEYHLPMGGLLAEKYYIGCFEMCKVLPTGVKASKCMRCYE